MQSHKLEPSHAQQWRTVCVIANFERHTPYAFVCKQKTSDHLDLDLTLSTLRLLALVGLGLGTHDATTPVTLSLLILVHVALLDGLDELGELSLVLGADLGDGKGSGGLLEKLAVRNVTS